MKIKLNKENFIIKDYIDFYGGNQDWYDTYFKKIAGCAPTTAATITMYETKKEYKKQEFVNLMNEIWEYITPGLMGVNKVEKYEKGYNKYIIKNNINLKHNKKLHIDKTKTKEEVFDFIKEALNQNHPIAFLNLDNGKETKIESWHWTTIIGIELLKNTNKIIATICDEGYLKDIDLTLWLETTTSGGDFIYYY